MNIAIVGHVCIDKNVSENSTYTGPGSPALFMNTIFKQFPDCQVSIISPYGKDYEQYLQGVSIFPQKAPFAKTLVYENVTKGGKRTQKAFNREEAIPVLINENMAEFLHGVEIVFFAPLLPNFSQEYIHSIVKILKKNTLKVLLPQGYFRDFDKENNVVIREFKKAPGIVPLMDVVVASEEDHSEMITLAVEWAKRSSAVIIITKGEKGAVAFTDTDEIPLPARPVSVAEIVDSVGSGDIFSAGFAYKYQQTHDIKKAGDFANELARQCLFYSADTIQIDFTKLPY